MSTIIDVNVTPTIEEVTVNTTEFLTTINVNTISGGGIQSVQAGANVSVDNTDPLNPIVSATFTPSDYDLEQFTNESADPFVRVSEVPPAETTASIQTKRPIKTVNSQSLEGSGNVQVGTVLGSGTANTLPVFTPDGNTLGNSRIVQFTGTGISETRVTNPVEPTLGVSFHPIVNVIFRLFRTQSRIDFSLGNPDASQENEIISNNYFGTSYRTGGFLRFLVNNNLEALRLLATGQIQITQTPATGTTADALLVRNADGSVRQIPTSAVGGAVSSVNGQTGVVVLAKSDVGLSNVDNTSDVSKPISTATQTALNAKQNTLIAGANITIIGDTISASGVGAQSINDMATSGSVISFNDFIGNFASGFNDGRFSIQTSGGFVSGSVDLLVTPPLGHTLTYSTSNSSASFITYRGSSIGQAFIANEVDFLTSVRIESLSDATNNNVFKFGVFTDSSTVNISNNGYGFIYNRFDLNDLLVNSANWIVFTKNGASITTFDTGIPVITTEYTKLRLVKSLDNTQVQFYINDVLVSTITTNIPTENSVVTPCLVFRKTLGTTAHAMRSDYVGLQINK